MSPINHDTTTAVIGGTQWNEDHTLPTLAEVAGEAAAATLLKATVTLTDADIRALPTTPFELIAAPGANKVIVTAATALAMGDLVLIHHHVADYADVDGDPALTLNQGSNGGYATINGFFDDMLLWGAPDDVYWIPGEALGSHAARANGSTDMVDQPITVSCDNSIDFTGGDAANTLTFVIWYRVLDVS